MKNELHILEFESEEAAQRFLRSPYPERARYLERQREERDFRIGVVVGLLLIGLFALGLVLGYQIGAA